MTRLNTMDISDISNRINIYDRELKKTLGYTLEEIAKKSVRAFYSDSIYKEYKVAVIPVTSGMGIINGFCETVSDILKHIRANVFVTEKTDVGGIQEAFEKNADIIFMSDDDTCAAFSLNGKVYSDNGYVTGVAFAAALEIMMEKEGEEVLILGAGPVGIAAAQYFSQIGAIPVICDLQEDKARDVASKIKNAKVEKSLKNLNKYTYILDASTSGDFIKEEDIKETTIISAPGIPLGAAKEIRDKVFIFHNPLEIGIMTMYFDCLNQLMEGKQNEY
ncbi:UNVERIFIED_CONTAM: pyrrolysine biosynthesis protein PylD [Acetivibrio alkalicellulosi]